MFAESCCLFDCGDSVLQGWQKEGEVGERGRTGGEGRREVGFWQSASKGSVIGAQGASPFPFWLLRGAHLAISLQLSFRGARPCWPPRSPSCEIRVAWQTLPDAAACRGSASSLGARADPSCELAEGEGPGLLFFAVPPHSPSQPMCRPHGGPISSPVKVMHKVSEGSIPKLW